MNKTTLLSAALLACCFAPPTDGGSTGPAPAPLLEGQAQGGDAGGATDPQAAAQGEPVEGAHDQAAAAQAAPTPPSADKPAAANSRTQARLDPTKKPVRSGARARKSKAVEKAAADLEAIVGIVLQTSRVNGADGRAIPRRTVALAKSARADALIERGWARAATEAETAKATIVLD